MAQSLRENLSDTERMLSNSSFEREMEDGAMDFAPSSTDPNPNPNPRAGGGGVVVEKAKKVVVVMGATGAGKSRLAIDLASHFDGVEILNADSMQVYRGLDVLTNKLPLPQRNGVPHHLLGTIDASVDFTSKDFRDLAVPIIDDILSRNGLPVIVGGTNYYIQALVSPFLIDDVVEDTAACSPNAPQDWQPELKACLDRFDSSVSFDHLKEIDPVAANRIHPNDHRKINRYLSLYASSGVLPSVLFQGKAEEADEIHHMKLKPSSILGEQNFVIFVAGQKWGRADNFRYDCCFIWVDASLLVLDRYVDHRVDCMIDAGLLNEVYDIYNPNADYTRGLRQAIGVQEFEEFFKSYFFNTESGYPCSKENVRDCNGGAGIPSLINKADKVSRPNFSAILDSDDNKLKILLGDAIDKLKANTRRLVRRQKRRLNRLKTYFGWDLHYIDATEAILSSCEDSWQIEVVEPCVNIVKAFLCEGVFSLTDTDVLCNVKSRDLASRDLWTQYVCEACGNQILRGAHEWEQHKQGRGHRKRILRLKKRSVSSFRLATTS